MKREQIETARQLIAEVIEEWDPLGLPAYPDWEEYSGEVSAIVRQVDRMQSEVDAAHVVSRVFASSFSDPARFSVDNCLEVGRNLHSALSSAGILK